MNRSGACGEIERTVDGRAGRGRLGETTVRGTVSTAGVAARLAMMSLVALSGLWTAGCYDTPRPSCGFTCSKDGACPDGYVCGTSNRCRLPSVPDGQCTSAAPGMGPDAMPVDAMPVDAAPDAPPDAPVDAMPVDAAPDAPVDAMPDAPTDAMPDAPTDAPVDAMPDAAPDAPA